MTTRRSFLGSLALLPFSTVAKTPAKPLPVPSPAHIRRPEPHDPALGIDFCLCDACHRYQVEREDHGLACRTVLTLDRLDAALGHLIASHCEEGIVGCGLCSDADGLRYVVQYGTMAIDSALIPPDEYESFEDVRDHAKVTPAGEDVNHTCCLALHDAFDALLDLVDGHCHRDGCSVCIDADGLIHHVKAGIDLIGGASPRCVPMFERELLTYQRMVERERSGKGGWMPHMLHQSGGAEQHVACLERLLRDVRAYAK